MHSPPRGADGRVRRCRRAAQNRHRSPVSGLILADRPFYFKQRVSRAADAAGDMQILVRFRSSQAMNGAAPVKHTMAKYSVRIAGHATSVSLEPEFWEALCEIAARRGLPVNTLLAAIDAGRSGNLSSAIRLFVLESCRRGELVR
jgi:predicted DNA-binding ribbon-helix-helix protein